MSSAHRPTWDPAQGKDSRSNSRMYSSRDMASHTRLKFRQPGQGTTAEVSRRDLKLELLAAESASATRKSKGLPGFAADAALVQLIESAEADEESAKRRKVLVEVGGLDADDEEESGKESAGEESAEESDEEDETAELLRELEKIKRERAEEKEKIEREKAANEQTSREEEIATGNPLLNLQSALNFGASPSPSMMSSTGSSSSFGIKRRWDDDVIFKNQARGTSETPKKEFVNDLLRTEFHKRFLKKFIA